LTASDAAACTELGCYEPAVADGLCEECREDLICVSEDCNERNDDGEYGTPVITHRLTCGPGHTPCSSAGKIGASPVTRWQSTIANIGPFLF